MSSNKSDNEVLIQTVTHVPCYLNIKQNEIESMNDLKIECLGLIDSKIDFKINFYKTFIEIDVDGDLSEYDLKGNYTGEGK